MTKRRTRVIQCPDMMINSKENPSTVPQKSIHEEKKSIIRHRPAITEDDRRTIELQQIQKKFQAPRDVSQMILKYIAKTSLGVQEDRKTYVSESWIKSLSRAERIKIEREKTVFPQPKFLTNQEISKGITHYFGEGCSRRLRPGEEAFLIRAIEELLEECFTYAEKTSKVLSNPVSTIVVRLCKRAHLEYLLEYPVCVKQIDLLWRINYTRQRNDRDLSEHRDVARVFENSNFKSHMISESAIIRKINSKTQRTPTRPRGTHVNHALLRLDSNLGID